MSISLQSRLNNFVTWIRPDPDKAEETLRQRDEVKARIKGQAEKDGLVVRSMPNSGSFAKATGLRRHMLGSAEHEGQDIDCPFVLSKKDEGGDLLTELLPKFKRYAERSYPDTEIVPSKSSIKLKFSASKLNFDLVPMLAVDGDDEQQVIIRANERRRTSVQRHLEFVKKRTAASAALRGPVAFNDALRLVKWWREYQLTQGKILTDIPSFLVELLCCKAFDQMSVQPTFAETLVTWFDQVYALAARRSTISFTDFGTPDASKIDAKWKVIDPVNTQNNAVPSDWSNIQIDEFRDWAARARDTVQQAIAFELRGREADAVALLSQLFGSSFENHSEGK